MEMLKEVKLLKGITDNVQDNVLILIIDESKDRILQVINEGRDVNMSEVPSELNFIVRDVSIARFNRIDAEGMNKTSEEGLLREWQGDLLKPYMATLTGYHDKDYKRNPSIRFID